MIRVVREMVLLLLCPSFGEKMLQIPQKNPPEVIFFIT
jgi:hypothetical protein